MNIRKSYEEKTNWLLRQMNSPRKPPKEDTQAYITWLENRVQYLARLRLVEMSHKVFPQKPRVIRQRVEILPEKIKRDITRDGHVYLLKAGDSLYKIGRAKDPNNRMRTFNVKLPFPVEYEHLIKTDDMYALERQLHRHFQDKHVNGEWFALDIADVDYIKSL